MQFTRETLIRGEVCLHNRGVLEALKQPRENAAQSPMQWQVGSLRSILRYYITRMLKISIKISRDVGMSEKT